MVNKYVNFSCSIDMSLFQSFSKKIGNLLSEKPEKQETDAQETTANPSNKDVEEPQSAEPKSQEPVQESEPVQEPPVQKNTNEVKEQKRTEVPLETKEELLRVVCDWLADYTDAVGQSIGNQIVIWLDTNQLTFQMYNTDDYRQRVLAALVNECDLRLDTITFHIGIPAEELRCTPVSKSGKVFLQIKEEQPMPTSVSKKAIISIFGNTGSLLKEEYVLSSDEMKAKRISVYNIGAGEFPKIPTGYRQNHIAIDDNPNGDMIEKNKYVSRMHAHIGFSDKFGFYLQVERDGTRLMGKRTRIFRGEEKIEMDNPQAKEPLQDGDLIELGKAVVLKYVELEK